MAGTVESGAVTERKLRVVEVDLTDSFEKEWVRPVGREAVAGSAEGIPDMEGAVPARP